MKKFFVTVLLALTVLVSAAAQEENKTLIKINVIDSDLTPKIYVSKLPNFMGHKVLCEGSGEGYVDPSYGYIGFGYTSLQPLKMDKKVIEFNAELGNPTMNTIGIISSVAGAVFIGTGGGLIGGAFLFGGADEAKKMLPLGIGLAGTGVAGVTAGLIISGKNKPKLIRVN